MLQESLAVHASQSELVSLVVVVQGRRLGVLEAVDVCGRISLGMIFSDPDVVRAVLARVPQLLLHMFVHPHVAFSRDFVLGVDGDPCQEESLRCLLQAVHVRVVFDR